MTGDHQLKQSHWHWEDAVFLVLLSLACFWPFTFGVFSAKNDNIVQFLPVRFHVSEALRHGQLPLWSAYMYLGYPIHGDMQGGAWNPVVWFLSIFGRYNLFSIHAEILLYIIFSGLGMYRLLGAFHVSRRTRITGAAAFLMCGYITDVAGSNLPFLASAAWIPFVCSYFLELFRRPGWKKAAQSAIALWLLFVSAYPSFFILTCYILLAALVVLSNREARKGSMSKFRRQYIYTAIGFLFFLFLSAPAILSYTGILPFYNRVHGVSYLSSVQNTFAAGCSLSFILPPVPVKMASVAGTDLISRNSYFNIFFLLALFSFLRTRKGMLAWFTMAGTIFFFLFSLGDQLPVRKWCYDLLPLMDSFRHPSNARLFVIMGGILCGCLVLDPVLAGREKWKLPWFSWIITSVMLCAALTWSIVKGGAAHFINLFSTGLSSRSAIKSFFDAVGFPDLVFIAALVQLVFLTAFYFLLKKPLGHRTLALVIMANSFVCAQLSLPYTIASKQSPQAINRLLRSYPHGFPPPSTSSIGEISAHSLDHFNELGISGFYSKNIGTTTVAFTPTFLTMYEAAMKDTVIRRKVMSHPYIWFEEPSAAKEKTDSSGIKLNDISANSFQFHVSAHGDGLLHLQQTGLPGWRCTIDGKKTDIHLSDHAFMAVQLGAGDHEVDFRYHPKGITACVLVSMVTLLMLLAFLIKKQSREK